MKINVIYDREEYVTREADPNVAYDNDSTAASIHIHGIEVAKEGCCDGAAPFDLKKDRTYYLVWADYNTGDSFGKYGNRMEFIDLFETKELAEQCAKAARDTPTYTYAFKRENGIEIKQSAPWIGYFESLNDVNVKEVKLL